MIILISLKSFRKNFYNTGDLGYFDKQRNLVIIGRNDFSFRVYVNLFIIDYFLRVLEIEAT